MNRAARVMRVAREAAAAERGEFELGVVPSVPEHLSGVPDRSDAARADEPSATFGLPLRVLASDGRWTARMAGSIKRS